jgi:gliding motility-associated-like protein
MPALAQKDYYNWYFYPAAGMTFNGAAPTFLPGNPFAQRVLFTQDQLSTISDSLGRVLFVTDGREVWDRNRQLMPNGAAIAASIPVISNTQSGGDLVVKMPGNAGRYFILQYGTNLLGLPTACPDFFYTVVNMRARNGLGDVEGRPQRVLLPAFTASSGSVVNCLRSNIEAIRHANGQDLWLVMRNGNDLYFSFLLTSAGITTPAVQSAALPKTTSIYSMRLLKASADSRRLVFSEASEATLDIETFDPATGRVQPGYRINNLPHTSGLALSPDGSKLYVDTLGGRSLWQYDLSAGAPPAVEASRQKVATLRCHPSSRMGDLQTGPDGCLYIQMTAAEYIGRLRFPNVPGKGSRFEEQAVALGVNVWANRLVRLPNDLGLPPVQIQAGSPVLVGGTLADSAGCDVPTAPPLGPVTASTLCREQLVYFYSNTSPFLSATAYQWDFGDPASGPDNTSTGQAPTHRFDVAGNFTVRLRIQTADGREFTSEQQVQVQACDSQLPNIITPNGDGRNDTFVLQGLDASSWRCRIFNRWGQQVYNAEAYANDWGAPTQPGGVYFYQLTNNRTGRVIKGWLEVVR